MEAVLQIQHLCKWFGKRKVIDDISFSVNAGEVFGFLGPNGAGKTTTIKMIMGFLSIDRGTVVIDGLDRRLRYEAALAKIGGIVENPEMYKELSGRVNLEMYARLHDGVTPARIDEVLDLVGMQNRAHEKVKKYSLGMKQRIGLAQALLHRPRVLILDEPTNGLDPMGIKELRDILKRMAHEESIAVFVSSHMLPEMEQMCDRVGIINNGRLLGVKPIGALLEEVSGKEVYRVLTTSADMAASLAVRAGYSVQAEGGDWADIALQKEQVPLFVALLVENRIPVYGVSRLEQSLESAFIQITGGGNTIA